MATTTVTNKTPKPLSVPLSRGKKLFLGPGKSGEIAASEVERPVVKALIEDGSLEVGQGKSRTGPGRDDSKGRASQSVGSNRGSHRGGDR
jgi:hypothetical protein